MINLTEEDIQFIVNNIIIPCVSKQVDEQEKLYDIQFESFKRIGSVFAQRISELDYKIQRDRMFFLSFLSKDYAYDLDLLKKQHKIYCDEFDKLNKHLLEDDKENNNEVEQY